MRAVTLLCEMRPAVRTMAWLTLCLLAGAAWAAPHPFGVPETGAAGGIDAPGWLGALSGDLFARVAAWQSQIYLQLTGAVRAWQAEGGQGWLLAGLSFAYGVFHALGPGHGKAVISAYVLASRQTARNGALLALASGLAQALVAVIAVALLAGVLDLTATAMNRATHVLEMVSYALVLLLGLWLVWVKALRPLWRRRGSGGHEHGGHVHAHAQGMDCGCGHAHAPTPEQAAGSLSWRGAAGALLAVGLRPCSGALIVLVFALSQGFFRAGVVAALAMGLGTGLTVAALVGLAVLARDGAARLGGVLSAHWLARLRYGIEALAACAVLALGVLLLGGQLASA